MSSNFVALIPVRGGSKSIPLKNIKMFAGKPLVYWTIKAANDCPNINEIYVSTDCDLIKQTVESFGFDRVTVIDRSEENASDIASTESVMLEFASQYDFENIVLIQATSPLLCGDDLVRGIEEYKLDGVDSVLSVVKQKRFLWEKNEFGQANSVNYDVYNRPRRQDFDGFYVENGAYYITSKKKLIESQNRVSGTIHFVEMPEDTYFEIDEPSDWRVCETLFSNRHNKRDFKEKLKHIKLFLTDCDGCLTDGGMYYSENGDEIKKFNTKDGMAFQLLKSKGFLVGIITGENKLLNKKRADKLKVDVYEPSCIDKLDTVKKICEEYHISMDEVLYIGDDLNDLNLLHAAGFSACPQDAHDKVKNIVDYISVRKGGAGVIRDVADLMLEIN